MFHECKKNINNLKKVSTILPQIFKKINKKGNPQLLEIKMNWTSIIGKEYAEQCHVSSLKKLIKKTYSLFTAAMQAYLNFLIQLLKLKKK